MFVLKGAIINVDSQRNTSASYCLNEQPDKAFLVLSGPLLHSTVPDIWKSCRKVVEKSKASTLIIDADKVSDCDGAGIGLLTDLLETAENNNTQSDIINLKSEFEPLFQRYRQSPGTTEHPRPQEIGPVASLGKLVHDFFVDLHGQISFLGHFLSTSLYLITQPQRFRWNDFLRTVELAGVRGVEIVALLGFLFGLIMAFSSAMPLKQFGVEVYVSDLVAIALVRVLGPFITAIIVAGRTGSAFAAEIGTMKVNNEIDALKVMNLDPITFLVIPRTLATTLVTPLLAIVANLLGLIGCGLVILSLGYPLVVYMSHIHSILTVPDVLVGLSKALVYGWLVGMIGCMRGLQTQLGAGAVGIATTRAVVTAIIALVIMEGIFSVVLYYLQI